MKFKEFDNLASSIRNSKLFQDSIEILKSMGKKIMDQNVSVVLTPSDCQHPTHEEIQKKAYDLWDSAGKPESDGVEYWVEAEKQLIAAVGKDLTSCTNGLARQPRQTSE